MTVSDCDSDGDCDSDCDSDTGYFIEFHRMRGTSWLAEELSACKKGCSSKELYSSITNMKPHTLKLS